MTFSIVARDAQAGQLGVAVATSTMAVGRAVPWARAGAGVIATQAQTNRMYGYRGLELLAKGLPPQTVLQQLQATDQGAESRQIAMVSATGDIAAWTGRGCLSACGHVIGDGFSAQGNMLRSRSVVPSMAEKFRSADGDLAERLLAALTAAEEAGGDIRGRQSAAIMVVSAVQTDHPWDSVFIDLRVDDNSDPVSELIRLVALQRAYESGNWAAVGEHSQNRTPELYAAMEAVQHGDREKARAALQALRQRPGWEGALRRMMASHRSPNSSDLLNSD